MKYTAQTIKYNIKNLLYIFPLAILPAFFLSLTLARADVISVAEKIRVGSFSNITFWELFQALTLFNFSSWETVVAGVLGVAALVVCGSLLMAFTDKHMRFGKRTFNGLFAKLNDNLLSTFGFTLLLLVLYEVWTLLLTVVLQLCFLLPQTAVYVVATVVVVVMHVALTYAISLIYLWLPCMQITGFHTFEALRYGFLLCEPIQGQLIWVQTLSMIVAEGAIVAATLLLPSVWVASMVVATLLYAFLILQFCVRMQIVYFDREQIERADLKKYYE
ncbi:MAG: hypothetical protein IJF39_01125 [Clostridia bacterium]|nr:hypothetical protein [Clostridia bacterium]